MAHRRGALIIPRMADGKRFDSVASWKVTRLGHWLERLVPAVHRWVFYQAFNAAHKSAWGQLDPAWKLDSDYSNATNVAGIVLNDNIVPALREGSIISVPYIERVTGGPRSVQFTDGRTLDDVDCIIACTGYKSCLEITGEAIPHSQPAPDVGHLPRLYQNIFPVVHADSLAVLSYNAFMDNASTCRELAGMAIAQLWAGKSTLPSRDEMESQIEEYQDWFVRRCLSLIHI